MHTIDAMHRSRARTHACLAALTAALLAACGGGDDKDPLRPDPNAEAGTVSGQVSGDVTMSLAGGQSAVMIHDGPFLGITMGEPQKYTLIIQRKSTVVPAPGTYQLGDGTDIESMPEDDQFWAGLIATVGGQGANAALSSRSGTLTISSSSASRIKGQFTAVLSGYRQNADQTATPIEATVTGSFDAPVVRLSAKRQ